MTARICALGAVAGLGLALACGSTDRDALTSGVTAGPGVTGASSDGTGGAGSDGGGVRFDVNGRPDGGGTAGDDVDRGCEKIDFLFVIDNSGSMEDEQHNLITSFPGFISTIEDKTSASSFQILVADTDVCDPNMGAGQSTTCSPDCCPSWCPQHPGGTCNGSLCGCPGVGCDNDLGGGIVNSQTGQPCPIDSGKRYMRDGQANLADTFACVAHVGIEGNGNEQPMASTVAALGDPMIGAGGCNEGFVRPDALQVIVIITDEEDDHEAGDQGMQTAQPGSPGDPPAWFDAVIGQKDNKERNVVVLSLVGPEGADACPPLDKNLSGVNGAEIAYRILEFTNRFTFGFVGPVCAPNYDSFFQQAVDVVDIACDEYVPPG